MAFFRVKNKVLQLNAKTGKPKKITQKNQKKGGFRAKRVR